MGADDNWQRNLFLPLGKVRMGYPTGEDRWGLMAFNQSNLFLPLGKVRMGYPTWKVRMGYPTWNVRMGSRPSGG